MVTALPPASTVAAARTRRVLSLRWRVFGLAAAAVLPALAGVAWILHREEAQATQVAFERATLLASGTAGALRWAIEDAEQQLERQFGDVDAAALAAVRCDREEAPRPGSAVLRRPDGQPLCGPADGAADAPWFAAIATGGAPMPSDAWRADRSQPWVTVISRQLPAADGAPPALATIALELRDLNERLFRKLPPTALVVVVGRDGRVLLRSRDFEQRVGQPIPARFRSVLPSEGAATLVETGVDGVERMYATIAMPGIGWQVWAAFPADEVLAGYRATRWRTLLAAALALALVAGLALRLVRSTLRPVQALADTARAVAAGDRQARASVGGPAEIRDVAREFNRMLDAAEASRRALADSESRFRALAELSTDWFWSQDESLRFTALSDGLQRQLGAIAAGDLGRRPWELPGLLDTDPAPWAAHRAVLERREPFRDFEFRRRGGDGRVHVVQVSGEPLFRADGSFAGYRGVARDVTRQREIESEVAAREVRYRSLIDALPVGVVVHAPDTSIELFNPEACRLLGMSAEQMNGRAAPDPAWHFVDADGRAMALADYPVMRVLNSRRALQGMTGGIVAHGDGEITWVHIEAFPEHDATGALQRIVVVFVDITAERQAQVLREAREMAEMANRAKSQFVSRMSHELRTPLNAVLGFSQLLQMDPAVAASERALSQVRLVHDAGTHLLALVNDLLDLSRIESGELALETAPMPLRPAIDDCLSMVRPLAEATGIALRAGPASGADPWACAEATRVRQVLVNLVTNAIKYNRPQGEVVVETEADRDRVRVHVRDTGFGLSPLQMAGIFKPFGRLDAEARGIEGTGLGLVISRQLAELMGGRLEATSTPGIGTTFTLTLPRCEPAVEAAGAVDAPPPPASAPPRLTCVCIEDNPTNARLISAALAQRPEVDLHLASDGESGIELVRRLRPQLLLLDLDLPGIDGHEVLRRLRAANLVDATHCVAVTAWSMPADLERARASGFDEILTKPFEIRRLIGIVDRAVAG